MSLPQDKNDYIDGSISGISGISGINDDDENNNSNHVAHTESNINNSGFIATDDHSTSSSDEIERNKSIDIPIVFASEDYNSKNNNDSIMLESSSTVAKKKKEKNSSSNANRNNEKVNPSSIRPQDKEEEEEEGGGCNNKEAAVLVLPPGNKNTINFNINTNNGSSSTIIGKSNNDILGIVHFSDSILEEGRDDNGRRNKNVAEQPVLYNNEEDCSSSTFSSKPYPADTYSLLSLHGPVGNPVFFSYGLMVYLFQMTFLVLMVLSVTHPDWSSNGDVDNPDAGRRSNLADAGRRFILARLAEFVPSNVSPLVRATQITATLSYVIFADSTMLDVVTAVELFPNFKQATSDNKLGCMVFASILRLSQGIFAITVTLLLIVTSSTTIEIILNFTAINFISTLDNVGFQIIKWGKYGPTFEEEARRIEKLPLPKCIYRKYEHVRYLCTIIPIGVILFSMICSMIFLQESNNQWVTKIFRVQFQDKEQGLQVYNGCYEKNEDAINRYEGFRRKLYESFGNNAESAKFSYCIDDRRWILFKGDTTNACEARGNGNELARSSKTDTFDVSTMFEEQWFTPSNTPLNLYFVEENGDIENGDIELNMTTCSSFINDGNCDSFFNKFEFQYDGGDCCAATCSGPNCGIGSLKNTFGTTNATGDGFPDCTDPDMVPITIRLDNILSSFEPIFKNIDRYDNSLIPDGFNESSTINDILRIPDGFNKSSTINDILRNNIDDDSFKIKRLRKDPIKPLLFIDCDGNNVLDIYVYKSMESQTEKIMVSDGADCTMTIRNDDSATGRNFDPIYYGRNDDAIWYVDYTILHGDKESIESSSSGTFGGSEVSSSSGSGLITTTVPTTTLERRPKPTPKPMIVVPTAPTTPEPTSVPTGGSSSIVVVESSSAKESTYVFRRIPECYFDKLSDYIDKSTVYTGIDYDPTAKAINWLMNDESENSMCENPFFLERYALAVIYFAAYNSPDYTLNITTRQCVWPSIMCDEGTVISLDMSNGLTVFNTSNFIPSEIGLMTSLKNLDLGGMAVFGPIPSEIGLMTSLTSLNLGGTYFSGSIPSEIGLMTSLASLTYVRSGFTGSIPSEIGLMTSLENLVLSGHEFKGNAITGSIPSEIGLLTSLTNLDLEVNDLTGSIPSEIGLMTSLISLNLVYNAFTGSIPSEIGLMTSLASLSYVPNYRAGILQPNALGGNDITGSIPSEIGLMTSLTSLNLGDNELTGSIPSEIGLMNSLRSLNLGKTLPNGIDSLGDYDLTGSIPSEIGLLTSLTYLNLSDNAINGSIPSEIGLMTSLKYLDLGDNDLTGTIPSEIGLMTSLTRQDLGGNAFTATTPPATTAAPAATTAPPAATILPNPLVLNELNGTIPSEIGLMTSLTSLDLYSKNITGSIPSEIGLLTLLKIIYLDDNDLTGTIPSEIGLLTYLEDLSLYSNELNGSIPSEIGLMTSLKFIYLDDNDLTGTIPSEIGLLTYLEDLYLNDNDLTGSIPSEIGLMTSLKFLKLFGNDLNGTIPSEIGLMTSLEIIYLGDNAVTGPIPSEIGLMTYLEELVVYDNALNGTIPSEIGLMTSLTSLDLSYNALNGNIPSEIGLLTSLEIIYLDSNDLTGSIPSEIGLMTSLEIIYLGDNAITGPIPSEIGQLTSLKIIYLASNVLTGTIPSEIGLMTSLTSLYLNDNALNGTIPSEIELMTSLENLDLFGNDLNGTNPSEIGLLTYLP